MDIFTIYCTHKQTEKALKLCAPINLLFENNEIDADNFDSVNECYTIIDGRIYSTPTAEQMIGWLESNGIDMIEVTCVNGMELSDWNSVVYPSGAIEDERYIDIIENNGFKNRKDATLAAIDAALEYLENNMPEPVQGC